MSNAWICTECGGIAEGDLCMLCGNTRGPQAPAGAEPGSYFSTLGYRTNSVWKPTAAFICVTLAIVGGGIFMRLIFLAIVPLILISMLPSFVLIARLLFAKWRAARTKGR